MFIFKYSMSLSKFKSWPSRLKLKFKCGMRVQLPGCRSTVAPPTARVEYNKRKNAAGARRGITDIYTVFLYFYIHARSRNQLITNNN